MSPAPTKAEQIAQGRRVTRLGFDLYHRLPAEDNLVISPLSVWMCLMMLVPGARGGTLRGLLKVLGAASADDAENLTDGARRLARFLTRRERVSWGTGPGTGKSGSSVTEVFTLEIANALWAAHGHPFHEAYVEALVGGLGAHAASVDYGDPRAAADRINAWVAENTRGRIHDLVESQALEPLTKLVLTNATYFKAAWDRQFEKDRTEPADFHAPGGRVRVPMMRARTMRGHVTDTKLGVEAVSMPYKAMHAVVIMPAEGSWNRAMMAMSGDLVDRVVDRMVMKSVDLHFPRFGVDSGFELTEGLAGLGLADLFVEDADLGGISPHPEPLWVSKVVHRANVTVDEAGTEASAATAGTLYLGSTVKPKRITMRVDRPFLFLVRDPDTRTVLFLARVVDPTA